MIDKNAPVGVFDSGVGGLTVAREIMRNLPSEKIVYFGYRHSLFQSDRAFSERTECQGDRDRL